MDVARTTQPNYCEYANGRCMESFDGVSRIKAFVCYPGAPIHISSTILEALRKLSQMNAGEVWLPWADMDIAGKIIFCTICKNMRFSERIVADVTTLNFNVLFEIGYAVGLGLPVQPIRDSSYIKDKSKFDELGLLDTIGFIDFQNSDQLSSRLIEDSHPIPLARPSVEMNLQAPLYLIKSPYQTEGAIRLYSVLKKCWLRFRSYDPLETQLSLFELRKQIGSSLGLIAMLLDPNREGSMVHNARVALAAGLAMSEGKKVLLLQEGTVAQPIDYREIVVSYQNAEQLHKLVERPMRGLMDLAEESRIRRLKPPEGLLEKLDLGDVAAENEISALKSYFLPTGQYQQARRGHARLVVGRKGSGKTAIFYAIRDAFSRGQGRIVLDLKPEGHQFTKLHETILSKLNPGVQEHTLTAFWNSIILAELANKINDDYTWAYRVQSRIKRYETVKKLYSSLGFADEGDFSERLLNLVNGLILRYEDMDVIEKQGSRLTEILFSEEIRKLGDAVAEYLADKDEVWLLIDNLDKSWPTCGSSDADILILRTLLEATRKVQRQLEKKNVQFHCLVFLRNDIYEHLIRNTPDKGKDTEVTLDWSDPELFKQLFLLRVRASGQLDGDFEDIWASVFAPAVQMEGSFEYILTRTLMRPRDFLSFIHRAIEVAVNRGHVRVLEEDLIQAEKLYSQDMLKSTHFELRDVYSGVPELLYGFLGGKSSLSQKEVIESIRDVDVEETGVQKALDLLLWFGVLGVESRANGETRYSYQVAYDMVKLLTPMKRSEGHYVIHPAFRTALECDMHL